MGRGVEAVGSPAAKAPEWAWAAPCSETGGQDGGSMGMEGALGS